MSKMLSMIYNTYTNKEVTTEKTQDNNVRQSIIQKFHQNWAIEYTSNGLYTLKEATLRLLNEDMVSLASVKAIEWTDRRKILTCLDDLVAVTCCDDGKIKVYTNDLKLLISIDLNPLLHFDKHSISGPSISTVKISKLSPNSERYDLLFLYEQTVFVIPLVKDSSNFQLYKMKSYANQILSFDIYNDAENGRTISLVLEHGEQESVFLNYPELEDSLVKVDKKPKHANLSTHLLSSHDDLIVNPKLVFSRDGTRCAFLSKSKKLYIYRVPFPFKNDSRTQYTSEIVDVVEFNWWSTSSVIICTTSNQLSVLDVSSKSNILGDGDITEDVEGMPIISSSHDGKFFLLEYDPNVNQLKLDQQFLLLQEQQKQMQALENASETSLFSAFATLLSFLFPKAIKEPEELKEENMIPSTLSLAYRLYRFCKKEPETEFKEKLEQGDLEEALSLAKSYSLDLDQVYKKMWKRQVISLFSLETLKQVSDKKWIVDECVQRVANNVESMRALLEYGLTTTGHMLNESDDEEIVQKRLKILYYFDRLELYLQLSDQHYKADQYNSFRNCDLLKYAKEKASMKDLESLRIVLSYGLRIEKLNHESRSISPHLILDILSFIPESLDPRLYEDMLPVVESGKLKRWDQINLSRLENDFCEEKSPKSDTLYPTSLEITEWYINRAETIDITSGMVSYAETLLNIGTSKNVQGLEEKSNQLQFLSQMIYNRGNLFNMNKQLLSIKDYEENMSNYDKFKLLINKNSSDIVSQLLNKGINFVAHCEEERTGKDSLIYRFLTHELAPYNFEQCCKVFISPQRTNLLGDNETIVLLAIECIYSVKNWKDNTENIVRVLNDLPTSNIHEELEDQVNQLKRNTLAITILSRHKLSIQLSLSMDLEAEGHNIMQELLQTGIKSGKSEKAYQTLYNDLNNLHKSCFAHLSLNDIYHQFLKNCCLSGHAHLAYDYIVSKCILPFDEADDAIYEATSELINSSVQPTDSSIMIAEKCTSLHQSLQNEKHISLSQEHKWKREMNILEAFRLIGRTFMNYPPALFLKKNSSVQLVKYLIEYNETGTDESSLESFYNISKLLGGTEHEKKEIKKLAIEASLNQAGSGNISVIKTLMEQKHTVVYKICSKMSIDSMCDISHEDRLNFASYAIQNCESSELSEMISNYELIESQELFSIRSSIKPLTECVLLAHQEFEKLSKNRSFNANFVGCAPIYSTSSDSSSFLSKFGISSNSSEIEQLLKLKSFHIRNCIATGTDITLQSLLEFASLSLLNGHIISFISILIQVPIEQIDQVKKLFDSILLSQPRDTKSSIVERMLRVFNFYFGLRLLLLENPDGLSDYYNELGIEETVEKALESELKNEFTSIVDILSLYNGLLYICNHFNELSSLSNNNLSCLRFISEEDYRVKSLTMLSQTSNRDHLQTVLQVAEKLKLQKDVFYLCYLETVLKKKSISQEERSFIFEFITSINREKVTDLLLQSMQPSLSKEYELTKLAFFMDMLLILGNDQYRDQKVVLETLCEECNTITNKEYHEILNSSSSDALFTHLCPYINHQNVNTILESVEKVNTNVERPRFYFFVFESLLTSTNIDSKEKLSLVEEYMDKLKESDIRTIIEKLSFNNTYKIPHAIRIAIMENFLKVITDNDLKNFVCDNMFRMLAAKRVFQREELDNLLGLLDKYFRNQVGLTQVLANIALCTRSKAIVEAVLNDLKEEYTHVFPDSVSENNDQPEFISTDGTKSYLQIINLVIQCLVDHAEELSNETETNDEEDFTQEELENLTYEEDGLCWPPNNSKLACTYLHIILGSVKDSPDLFSTIISHIEYTTKEEDDIPVRTRIALIRIIRKYKKPQTPSLEAKQEEQIINQVTIEDSPTSEIIHESPKEETPTSSEDEDILLAIYQTKDAIGENFPTQMEVYNQTPKPPSDEFKNMFSSLLSSASNEKQFKALSFILRIWYKEKNYYQSYLETLLFDLLETLLEKNVKDDTVLEITCEGSELITETSVNNFFEKVFSKGNYILSFKFALQTNNKKINMLVVDKLKSLAESNSDSLDSESMSVIFDECISKNLISKLLSDAIITLLFNCKKLKLSENSEAHLVSELAMSGLKQKANNSQTLLACEYLQRKVFGMHARLCDLNSGLFLLRRYLQQCQTHDKIDKTAKEQCTNTLKKLISK